MYFSTLRHIKQAQKKIYCWISQNPMIIYLNGISENCYLFGVIVNASLKFFRALRGHLKGTWALG